MRINMRLEFSRTADSTPNLQITSLEERLEAKDRALFEAAVEAAALQKEINRLADVDARTSQLERINRDLGRELRRTEQNPIIVAQASERDMGTQPSVAGPVDNRNCLDGLQSAQQLAR